MAGKSALYSKSTSKKGDFIMIFTDGQLLTATDINNFLLNRETNPELDKAKTKALQRIEELKKSIPAGGQPLEKLPSNFNSTAVVMQTWSLKYTRKNNEVDIGDYGKDVIEIKTERYTDFPKYFLVYNHETMRIPELDWFWGVNLGEYFIDPQKNTFRATGHVDDPQEIRFITFSEKKIKLKIESHWKYFSNTSIEEVPDDLTKLLAAQR